MLAFYCGKQIFGHLGQIMTEKKMFAGHYTIINCIFYLRIIDYDNLLPTVAVLVLIIFEICFLCVSPCVCLLPLTSIIHSKAVIWKTVGMNGTLRDTCCALCRVIRNDCRGFNNLPPRSPDATPCDFFLWCYVKDRVYVPPLPASIPELKVRIGTATETITGDMLQTVWNEFDYRVDICRITKGAYIEHP